MQRCARSTSCNSIATTCSNPPCANVVLGEFVLGINTALGRATASAAIQTSSGQIFNNSIPINLSGIPITVNGNQITFSGTFDLANFPDNSGAFRCSQCGPPPGGPGNETQLTVSGTVNGSQATLTFAGTNVNVGGGGTASVSAPLSQQVPPNGSVAAIATPIAAGGADASVASHFNVQLDAAGRLLLMGPLVGEVKAFVGGASNTIAGADASAGNLVWGRWANGSTGATKAAITDSNYATFQPPNNSTQSWITGDASISLPPSLGVVTFTPIGSVFTGASQRLNSASLTADFNARSLSLSINATDSGAGATFQMNGTTGFSPTNSTFASRFTSVTCSGTCAGGNASGSYAGFFAGPQAQGAGVVFNAGVPNGGPGVSGAVALKR